MCWVCLIISIIGLASSISMWKDHLELDKLLETDPWKVKYLDYLFSGYGILGIIFSIPALIVSVILCIINYF